MCAAQLSKIPKGKSKIDHKKPNMQICGPNSGPNCEIDVENPENCGANWGSNRDFDFEILEEENPWKSRNSAEAKADLSGSAAVQCETCLLCRRCVHCFRGPLRVLSAFCAGKWRILLSYVSWKFLSVYFFSVLTTMASPG